MTPKELNPRPSFWLVAQCLNQLRHRHKFRAQSMNLLKRMNVKVYHLALSKYVKVKSTHDMPVQEQMGDGGTAPTYSQSGTSRRWVMSTMLRPLCHRERPHTHLTREGVRLGAGLDGTENFNQAEFDPRTVKPAASCYNG